MQSYLSGLEEENIETSRQDGGMSRHASPPGITTRRITKNLKTKNTQNCQKIELYRSPTTKDLKKPYSSRGVGGVEMWKWVERQCGSERW